MIDPHCDAGDPSRSGRHKRVSRKWVAVVFVVALAARLAWGLIQHSGGSSTGLEFPDEVQYWRMANSLHSGEGLKDEFGFRATRMPLYPSLLSLTAGSDNGIILAKSIQWIVGAVGAVAVTFLGTALFGVGVGVVAGLIVAVDPFFVFFSSLLLTETFAITMTAALWLAAAPLITRQVGATSWGRFLAVGLIASCCVYIRESSAGLAVLLVAFLIVAGNGARRWFKALVCLGVVVMSLVPWAVRNRQVTGSWCWLTYRSGISLYDGVGPQADGSSNLATVSQMPEVLGLDEVSWNRYFLTRSLEEIQATPLRVMSLVPVKLKRMWNPFPNVESYQSSLIRFISASWSIAVLGLALIGAAGLLRFRGHGRREAALFLLLPAVYFTALHCLFVGSVRYRMVAMPMLEILSAWALVRLIGFFGGERNARRN